MNFSRETPVGQNHMTLHLRRFRYSYSSVAKVGIGHYNDDSRNLSLSRRL